MAINLVGISSVGVFYLLVLMVGVYGAWKQKKSSAGHNSEKPEEIMLAKRNLGIFVGVLTMTGFFFPLCKLTLFTEFTGI